MEEIDVTMYKIPKIVPKLTVYEGGIPTIRNIGGVRNAMEMSDVCNLPSIHKVRYERETMAAVYIILCIYPREGLMGPRGTGGDFWGCEAAVRG